jgi:DNA (cytosine-5)-methyltransferase 1
MSRAYYNEFDKGVAAWLRELIKAGHIAPGDVDERDIQDVLPSDLASYTQCHFFAGIGVWSYALRRAGWPDDRPVWTGSCPCQPFSAAGKGAAFDDERHLWPAFHHLIKERRPVAVLGEQVASKDADPWIDLVQDDMEGLGYAFGAVPFPSAGIGAPHIRDRMYWVADSNDARSQGRIGVQECSAECSAGQSGVAGRMADSDSSAGRQGRHDVRGRAAGSNAQSRAGSGCGVVPSRMDDAQRYGRGAGRDDDAGDDRVIADAAGNTDRAGPTNGHWRDADWLFCRDGKWRPVEPGTFPLAHGASARVVRLRGYGNAINAIAAQTFIEAFMESCP